LPHSVSLSSLPFSNDAPPLLSSEPQKEDTYFGTLLEQLLRGLKRRIFFFQKIPLFHR